MPRCPDDDADDHENVNSDPDAELFDPEDDTIGFPGDPMADWPLEDDEEGEDEE
jgi:hypothetical protein